MLEYSVPGTTAEEHDWMICSELEEFVHIGWATKWIHKRSVFLVSVGPRGLPRALTSESLPKRERLEIGKRNNGKATAVITHQANQSQFICTMKLVSCSTHLQSYAKIDNETKLEKLRTVAKNKS